MKNSCLLLIALMPLAVLAQTPPGFDSEQMQSMMQKVQEMQVCMEKIDKSQLDVFEQRGKQMQQEVQKVCAAGRRDEALDMVLNFTNEIKSNPAIEAMKKCSEPMKGMALGFSQMIEPFTGKNPERHICDEVN